MYTGHVAHGFLVGSLAKDILLSDSWPKGELLVLMTTPPTHYHIYWDSHHLK